MNGKRGQITILDMVLVPILAIVLSLIATYFLQGLTANIANLVNLQPAQESCNLMLDAVFGNYYVHTAATLTYLAQSHPDQYFAATAEAPQIQVENCGPGCSLGSTTIPNSLTNSSSLYINFINYFASFSLNDFGLLVANNYILLNNLGLQVGLNQLPAGSSSASSICSLQAYNPENSSSPYTVYGASS